MSESETYTDPKVRMARLVRKDRLRHGEQRRIAKRLGIEEKDVSLVMSDAAEGKVRAELIRQIRVAIARAIRMSVAEAFPESEQAA